MDFTLELRSNPHYSLSQGDIDVLRFLPIRSDLEATRRFQAGEIDILPRYTPETELKLKPNEARIKLISIVRRQSSSAPLSTEAVIPSAPVLLKATLSLAKGSSTPAVIWSISAKS